MIQKTINIDNNVISINDIIFSKEGRARLISIDANSTLWFLIDVRDKFPFGYPLTVKDEDLDKFVQINNNDKSFEPTYIWEICIH